MEKIRQFVRDNRYLLLGALTGDVLLYGLVRALGIHPDIRHLLVQVGINVFWVGAMVVLDRRSSPIG